MLGVAEDRLAASLRGEAGVARSRARAQDAEQHDPRETGSIGRFCQRCRGVFVSGGVAAVRAFLQDADEMGCVAATACRRPECRRIAVFEHCNAWCWREREGFDLGTGALRAHHGDELALADQATQQAPAEVAVGPRDEYRSVLLGQAGSWRGRRSISRASV